LDYIEVICENTKIIRLTNIVRYFREALDAIAALGPEIIQLPDTAEVPEKICSDPKMFPYFANCIGSLDGTHIPARPDPDSSKAFRNRKGFQSQNVLAACTFDLKFVYMFLLAGRDPHQMPAFSQTR
jgi:hypothetical protein